jgi:NAD(P)-dependent dehydrogenase (short-subunit alcohol dehydrogenase family)
MKSCILVGYGAGMGAAIARAFGREGYRLALIARSSQALAAGERELDGRGYFARGYRADAGDEHALQQTLKHAEAECGPCEVLIYNAAALHPGNPLSTHRETLVEDFRTNVAGALTASQHVAHGMRARGRGTILFTGGGLALHPQPQYASLAVGKAGLRSLAFTLGEELKPDGIHVATVTICGWVKPGTNFDPDRIASAYLDLHRQPASAWQVETVIQ